jgi:3-hydroxy-9,10-secoandrosta-1,3,5(10)-triene-9,17-dione monooxygenase reductase component
VPDPTEKPAEVDAPEIEPGLFRQVLGHFPTGVTVVTAVDDDQPVGLAVGSFFSVSLDPPLVAFCPDKRSSSWPVIQRTGRFCVNVLAEDQEAMSRQFATPGVDKFAGIGWSPTAGGGSPRLADVLAWVDCQIEAVHDAGDHEICVGRVLGLAVEREARPLVFYRGGYGRFEP